MANYTFERLSAQDTSFLLFETSSTPMHVAATMIYEVGPLRTPEGGVDIDAFRRATASILHLIPRYRQKLQWIPLEKRPVWVDDRDFNLDYHIRHAALPQPGRIEQLKQLSARIMAQQLDRSRPLWETWVVEGLQGDRFAVISKIHHCMIDGSAGADLAQILLSPTPQQEFPEALSYIPRPAPSATELFIDSMLRRATLPLAAVRDAREFARSTEDLREELLVRLGAIQELLGWAVRPPSRTPLNGPLSSHRRFDWLTMPLEDVKAVKRLLGCTVNDIVLAVVTGAVREFLMRRRVNPETIDFRVTAPVSVRREEERGKMGNRVSSWILRLPIAEADPLRQLQAITDVTRDLKESRQALGVEMMMAVAEWTPGVLLSLGARAASGPINMIVTNVPGPQFPLYMLGARLLQSFPQVPLLQNTGLGVALFSYDGQLGWGFNADYDLVPDLPAFVRSIEASFHSLANAARAFAATLPHAAPPAVTPTAPAATRARRSRARGAVKTRRAKAESVSSSME